MGEECVVHAGYRSGGPRRRQNIQLHSCWTKENSSATTFTENEISFLLKVELLLASSALSSNSSELKMLCF